MMVLLTISFLVSAIIVITVVSVINNHVNRGKCPLGGYHDIQEERGLTYTRFMEPNFAIKQTCAKCGQSLMSKLLDRGDDLVGITRHISVTYKVSLPTAYQVIKVIKSSPYSTKELKYTDEDIIKLIKDTERK